VSDGEAKGKGILIAWIGAAVGIVSAAGVLYGIFHHPDTSVTDYQKQVQATCVRTHGILTASHSDIFQFNPSLNISTQPVSIGKLEGRTNIVLGACAATL
jgi:hypothetical protein